MNSKMIIAFVFLLSLTSVFAAGNFNLSSSAGPLIFGGKLIGKNLKN